MPGVIFSTGIGPVNDGQLEVSPDLNNRCFSSGRILASCIRAPAWCCCCHGNCAVSMQPISSFSNVVNRQLSADEFSEEIIHSGPILMKLYPSVLGVRFILKHTVIKITRLYCFLSYFAQTQRASCATVMWNHFRHKQDAIMSFFDHRVDQQLVEDAAETSFRYRAADWNWSLVRRTASPCH